MNVCLFLDQFKTIVGGFFSGQCGNIAGNTTRGRAKCGRERGVVVTGCVR